MEYLSSCYEVGAGYWNVLSVKSGIKIMNLWRKSGFLIVTTRRQFRSKIICMVFMEGKKGDFRSVPQIVGWKSCVDSSLRHRSLDPAWVVKPCLTEKGELLYSKPSLVGLNRFLDRFWEQGDHISPFLMGKLLPGDKRRLICLKLGNGDIQIGGRLT